MTRKSESSFSQDTRRARFERVFDAHYRAVSAYVLRRATPAEAEDAVAETFLVAWRRLDDVPPDVKPWLLGVARKVLANQRRAAGRRAALTARVAAEPRSGAEPPQRPPIIRALGRLSNADRELLLLVAWEGLSPAEAATTLECTQGAVKVRLHRARRRLHAELRRLERADATSARRLEECYED